MKEIRLLNDKLILINDDTYDVLIHLSLADQEKWMEEMTRWLDELEHQGINVDEKHVAMVANVKAHKFRQLADNLANIAFNVNPVMDNIPRHEPVPEPIPNVWEANADFGWMPFNVGEQPKPKEPRVRRKHYIFKVEGRDGVMFSLDDEGNFIVNDKLKAQEVANDFLKTIEINGMRIKDARIRMNELSVENERLERNIRNLEHLNENYEHRLQEYENRAGQP